MEDNYNRVLEPHRRGKHLVTFLVVTDILFLSALIMTFGLIYETTFPRDAPGGIPVDKLMVQLFPDPDDNGLLDLNEILPAVDKIKAMNVTQFETILEEHGEEAHHSVWNGFVLVTDLPLVLFVLFKIYRGCWYLWLASERSEETRAAEDA